MIRTFDKIALLGLHSDDRVAGPMRELGAHLQARGIEILVSNDVSPVRDARHVPETALATEADLIIAIGGDGTMLYAARLTLQNPVPLLGINRGRLGFLTDVSRATMLESVDAVLDGNYSEERRLLLSAELHRGDSVTRGIALNDVVIGAREPGRMVDVATRINDQFVNVHSGDGLIIATSTGSTAYALSCGGPIIQPDLDAFALVPICPHTLSDRPLVIPANATVDARLHPRPHAAGSISCDGQFLGQFELDDVLRVQAAENRVLLIHPSGHDYYELLRSKLSWGRNARRDTRH